MTELSFSKSNLVTYVTATFHPQTDITAYELAMLLPFFITGKGMTEGDWDLLGAAQRHLRRTS